MNRMMLERNIELAAGELRDRLDEAARLIRAKSAAAAIDVVLLSDEAKERAAEAKDGIRQRMDDGRYAIEDAIEDADYALFDDDGGCRKATVIVVTAGVVGLLALAGAVHARRRIMR